MLEETQLVAVECWMQDSNKQSIKHFCYPELKLKQFL